MCDPRITSEFWQTWKNFEVRHGNEDTMREMLRIKRSVQAIYNTQFNMMAVQYMNSTNKDGEGAGDAMSQLENKAKDALLAQNRIITGAAADSQIRFVRGETQEASGAKSKVVNPEEINIDDSEEDEEEEEEEEEEDKNNDNEANKEDNNVLKNKNDSLLKKLKIEQKAIPAKVFGGLKATTEDEDDDENNSKLV